MNNKEINNETRKYFRYDSKEKYTICEIDNCGKKLSGKFLISNLKRHITSFHKTVAGILTFVNLEEGENTTATPSTSADSTIKNPYKKLKLVWMKIHLSVVV